MADYHVRVILEAINRGGNNVSRFFDNAEKDLNKYRTSLRGVKKEIETFPGFGGTTTGRGPGGRFIALQKDADDAVGALRRFRNEFRQTLRDSAAGQALGGFKSGLGEEKAIREEVDRRLKLSKEARAKEEADFLATRALEKNERDKQFNESIQHYRQEQTAERIAAASFIRNERLKSNAIQDRINIQREALSKAGFNEEDIAEHESIRVLRDKRDNIEAVIQSRIDERKTAIKSIDDQIAAERRLSHVEFDNETKRRKSLLSGRASPVAIEQDVRASFAGLKGVEGDVDNLDNRLRRFGASAGRSLGQFRSGLRIAKNGLSDTEKEMLKSSSAAERFGARLGNAVRPSGAFRTRILLLIGALQVLGTLLVQVGSALVALASSAIMAGAALGGALLAGATQLIPVIGLLAATFHRLSSVLNAANLQDKLNLSKSQDQATKLDQVRQAAQRLADARYSLMKSAEAVKDSEYDLAQAQQDVKDAIKEQTKAIVDLAEARKQAARDIVDANFAEKDAALALQAAELGVLDAKQKLREEEQKATLDTQNIADAQAQVKEAQARLAQARKEGDQAEIGLALQQLSQAEQDLQQIKSQADSSKTSLKEAQLGVKQAQQQQKEAVVANKRAQEDAASARKKGVEGSDRVVAAQEALVRSTKQIAQSRHAEVLAERGVRDAIHALAVAKREEKDAEVALTEAKTKGTAQQQQLQQALGDLSPAEKTLVKSIQHIKEIYKKNFRPITDIIIGAISRAVDKIAILFQDPAILKGAKGLATAIADSIDKISSFAISPEFKHFLEFSLKEASKNVPKLTDGFIALAKVLIRISEAATPVFDKLLDRFVKFLEQLDKRTQNTKGLEKFFGVAGEHLNSWLAFAVAVGKVLGFLIKFSAPSGKGLLDDLTAKLNEWADWLSTHGPEVRKFFANVRIQVSALAGTLGKMAVILFKAFSSDSASQLSIFILNTVIPAFALFLEILSGIAKFLNFIFRIPLVGPLAQNMIKFGIATLIAIKFVSTIIPLVERLWSLFILLKESTILLRAQLLGLFILEKIAVAFSFLAKAIQLVGLATKAALFTPPVGLIAIIAAIIIGIVLLDRKFHFLMPTLRLLLKVFQSVFNWIKDHWKLLLAILLGPFALAVLAIIKWHDKIIGFFEDIINWVRGHWKLLIVLLLAPFAIGGAIILGIIKFKGKLLDIIKAIPGLIVKAFETLPGLLLKIFNKIPGLLKDALSGLKDIVTNALSKIPIIGRLFGSGKVSDQDKKKIFNKVLADSSLDPERKKIKALRGQGLSPEEIIQALLKSGDLSDDQLKRLVKKYTFATGGEVPGGSGSAVPIIAHAGEWVLNKMQQEKVARNLGMSVQQLQMSLFGTGGASTAGTKPTTKAKPFSVPGKFNLVPRTDPDGIVVWFIEMADGAFGQVSPRDARRIINSGGEYIPGYVRRSSHGFNARFKSTAGGFERARGKVQHVIVDPLRDRGWEGFAKGGVVSKFAGPMIQSFAEGGTVLSQAGFGAPSVTNNKKIEQNFTVNTQGETDWNYVLRLGAIHAQNSYT